MNKQEFEQRTGINLTDDEYQKVEEMYMLCGNIDKDEFCKDYKKHKDSEMLRIFTELVKEKDEKLKVLKREGYLMVGFLLERAQEFGDVQLLQKAIDMVGHAEVIRMKIQKTLPFWDMDKQYILTNIK